MMEFKLDLALKVENDYMACIGCNDCMLACPLPQTRNITISELNYAVQQERITSQRVIDFVLACTQCRQCVPVCPADLSRADMVLFNKLKVEDVAPDHRLMLQIGENVIPSNWTLNALAQHLAGLPLFREVDVGDIRRLLLKVTLRLLAPQEILCREGDYHERLYVILEGTVEQSASTGQLDKARILKLGPGTFHGELAIMTNQAEPYTITALQATTVIEIPKAALFTLMQQSQPFNDTLTALYNRRAVWEHAKQSLVLGVLPDNALKELFARAHLKTLQAGELLFSEGEPPQNAYLVRSGYLTVKKSFSDQQERVLIYFREGDNFGFIPTLLQEKKNKFTVIANTRTEIIEVPGEVIRDILKKHPSAREQLIREAGKSESRIEEIHDNLSPKGKTISNTTNFHLSWTALLDKGIIQGHEVLVINQNICTDCNNCVDACGQRHGFSRLERSGLQVDNLLFPSACRHCEDPLCLLCSVNGIVRLPNGEITIVEDNCIGCGSCAERCPYDNIRIHFLDTKATTNYFKSLLNSLIPKKIEPIDLSHNKDRQQIAVKCDLCAGYSDYACVTACPVGAAFRIDPSNAFGSSPIHIGLNMKQRSADGTT